MIVREKIEWNVGSQRLVDFDLVPQSVLKFVHCLADPIAQGTSLICKLGHRDYSVGDETRRLVDLGHLLVNLGAVNNLTTHDLESGSRNGSVRISDLYGRAMEESS